MHNSGGDPAIAACQFEPTVGDIETNLEHVARIARSLPDSVAVAVFPELCVTGYSLDVDSHNVPGHETERAARIAAETNTALVVGLPESDGTARYNSLVYVDANGVQATYRKQRPWGDEADVFDSGNTPVVVDSPVGRLGFLTCYDLNFPELALEYADRGCDCLAVSAAWRESFAADWSLLSRARALDTTCYVAASNHTGDQNGRIHAGHSLIAAPDGRLAATAPHGIDFAYAPVSQTTIDTARKRNPVLDARSDVEE